MDAPAWDEYRVRAAILHGKSPVAAYGGQDRPELGDDVFGAPSASGRCSPRIAPEIAPP